MLSTLKDLFVIKFLSLSGPTSDSPPYEVLRAQELNTMLGPKGGPGAVDLVCDLHSTTANMGLCFIAYSDCDWICLHIFKHLQVCETSPFSLSSFFHL